jgi:hypothetical protein
MDGSLQNRLWNVFPTGSAHISGSHASDGRIERLEEVPAK